MEPWSAVIYFALVFALSLSERKLPMCNSSILASRKTCLICRLHNVLVKHMETNGLPIFKP
jgi:hypothetical protein